MALFLSCVPLVMAAPDDESRAGAFEGLVVLVRSGASSAADDFEAVVLPEVRVIAGALDVGPRVIDVARRRRSALRIEWLERTFPPAASAPLPPASCAAR